MANLEIQSATEENNCWSYQVKLDEGRSSHQYKVTLWTHFYRVEIARSSS